ncbi:Iron(III) dicitrate transport system permease protein fecD [Roseomonas mucosa]|uniref:FecCD family ABC transporter permease n=1 Tax=Roseomonas mucosa TaxID=207340 RepID=UPI002203C8AA|nr:iron ABC transporter permease [Roseomonas mucosa]QDJ08305.1 Iron(III) dicitrate transport system permease protein fecD [Roseomonas mucosa]
MSGLASDGMPLEAAQPAIRGLVTARPGATGQAARLALALLALLLLGLCIALAVSVGEMPVPLATTLKALANRLLGAGYAVSRIQEGVIWDYRLSRALMAACLGGELAVAGAVLQALLRNPLAEPYVLGISAGASTGAVMVVVLGLGGGLVSLSGGAFFGALAALLAVAALATASGGGAERVILAGVVASQLFNAITAYVVTTAANAEQARGVMFWLLGNLSGVRWPDLALAAPTVLVASLVCLFQARALDAFTFGADAAMTLGIPVGRVRALLFAVTAAMTAVLVSITGTVGFVGLVVPHAARFLVGPSHARLLPASLIMGAILAVLADILSRILVPQQTLPIGVVTALFGAPAFAVILCRSRRSV